MYSQQTFLYNGKRLQMDHPGEMPLKGGIVALCLTTVTFQALEDLQYCMYGQQTFLSNERSTAYIVHSYC